MPDIPLHHDPLLKPPKQQIHEKLAIILILI